MTTDAPTRLRLGFGRPALPMILQTEAAECTLACLAMIAAHHGLRLDLAGLRRRFAVSLKGSTLPELMRMADTLHLQTRAVRVDLDELPQLRTPCILHWDLNHFVVYTGMRRGAAVIHDPARGVRHVRMAELSRHLTGVVLELWPTAQFSRGDERQSIPLSRLIGPVSGLRRSLGQIFVLALALEVFMLLAPFYLQWVVDGVLVSGDRDLLVTLGLGFALLVVIQVATSALRSWAVLYLSSMLNLQWLGHVFAHLLRLPVVWFERRHQGDVMSRFGAVRRIQETLTTSFVEAVLDGLLVAATLVVMWLYSPRLSAIVLASAALYGLLRWAAYGPLREANEELLVHDARTSSHFLESLRGVQAIKLHNRQGDRQSRYLNLVVDTMNADIATKRLALVTAAAQRLLTGLERVLVIWVGALLVLDRQFTVGMLFAFIAYKEQFSLRMSTLIDRYVELRMLRLQAERLADIVLAEPEDDRGARPLDAAVVTRQPARIELRDVSFRYADGEPWVLEDCSLTIEPGESVALVGASGCGKTTLLKVLLGLQTPQQGEVLVDGQPLAHLGLAAWRDRVGCVMQGEALFAGSLLDNISFFDPQPDAARVHECAELAALHDDITALPMGYETLVGDLGTALSGGQQQRVLLARALYRRPCVLLLDEATSALDVDNERRVAEAIRQLPMTRIAVAHRPETVASAQRVVTLDGGRVVQDVRTLTAVAPVPGPGRVTGVKAGSRAPGG